MYRAEQDDAGCWVVTHDGVEIPALRCYDQPDVARDLAATLNWAEQDRQRHSHLHARAVDEWGRSV